MEMMFEFIMCRGSGVTLSKCNVPINVKVSCEWLDRKQNILNLEDIHEW